MASTTFVNYQTVIDAGWLNDVNSAVYSGTFQATTLSPTNITVSGAITANGTISGSGFSTYLASPPAIGGTTAAAGAFTTLSASSTVSGTGFNTYLASPPAIGGTTAASGKFTTLTSTSDATLHGLTVGLGAGSVSTNTAIGTSVLASGSLTGGSNTGVGYQALNGVTSGDSNSAFGISALTSITTGASNTGIGRAAVGNTTTGSYNTAVGRDSLLNNTTASNLSLIHISEPTRPY